MEFRSLEELMKNNTMSLGFPWNDNQIVEETYRKDNYKIINTKAKNNRIVVFCSGNGLYYPNTEEEFIKVVVEQDRYEWMNLASNPLIRKHYSKIIFIRDIYKQWYVIGINRQIDSIDKLAKFLEKECGECEVTICGNSAGGYVAVLLGTMIKADKIIDISGQYNLNMETDAGPLIDKYRIDDRTKYYDLNEIINGNMKNIYYFYPGKCENDIKQNEAVKTKKINRFSFDETRHGITMRGICYIYILTKSRQELDRLCDIYKGQLIEEEVFYKRVVPWYIRILYSVIKKKKN